jgi:hypothetical protein
LCGRFFARCPAQQGPTHEARRDRARAVSLPPDRINEGFDLMNKGEAIRTVVEV